MDIITGTAALFAAFVALAPAHQQDGYRDTGCDASAQVAVTNDAGDVLHYTNSTCPSGRHGGAGAALNGAMPGVPSARK